MFHSNLLDNSKYDLEVSYNAAGILCHLASDGVQAWTNPSLDRDETLQRLVRSPFFSKEMPWILLLHNLTSDYGVIYCANRVTIYPVIYHVTMTTQGWDVLD